MEKQAITTVLQLVTSEMLQIEEAKKDYALKIKAAFEAHGITPDLEKAIKATAKSILSGKIDTLAAATDDLAATITIAKEVYADVVD